MKLSDFEKNIHTHEFLRIMGTLDSGGYYVKHVSGVAYTIANTAVADHDWTTLEDILVGDREARELRHMTRIVGYYSQIENWNKSNLGELKARQAGDYCILAEKEAGK